MNRQVKKISLLDREKIENRFAIDLSKGLLPDHYLYMDRCCENWLNLDNSEKFQVARKLTALLKKNLENLAGEIKGQSLLSIGVGSGQKEALILNEIKSHCPRYVCVDVNNAYLDLAAKATKHMGIDTVCITGFMENLEKIMNFCSRPLVLALLGNNFCNYHPEELLQLIKNNLGSDDLFLFDCALLTKTKEITDAYNSGLNERFNLGPLIKIGVPAEKCYFELTLIDEEILGMDLCRTKKQIIFNDDCEGIVDMKRVRFKRNDKLKMGFTFKYRFRQLFHLLKLSGFEIIKTYFDELQGNVIILSQVKEGK